MNAPKKNRSSKVADVEEDDGFGENDDDWHVYRKIVCHYTLYSKKELQLK